jgi:hypothetical protein
MAYYSRSFGISFLMVLEYCLQPVFLMALGSPWLSWETPLAKKNQETVMRAT